MELSQQYRQLDDPTCRRAIDIEDILQRTLRHLQGVQESADARRANNYCRQHLSLNRLTAGCQLR